jgi:hypothetical protein
MAEATVTKTIKDPATGNIRGNYQATRPPATDAPGAAGKMEAEQLAAMKRWHERSSQNV